MPVAVVEGVVVLRGETGTGEDFLEKIVWTKDLDYERGFKKAGGKDILSKGHCASRSPEGWKCDVCFGNLEARDNIQNIWTIKMDE